jgi:hypothetical protein
MTRHPAGSISSNAGDQPGFDTVTKRIYGLRPMNASSLV